MYTMQLLIEFSRMKASTACTVYLWVYIFNVRNLHGIYGNTMYTCISGRHILGRHDVLQGVSLEVK